MAKVSKDLWGYLLAPWWQVKQLYALMNIEPTTVSVYVDAWGTKRLISLALRRWRSPINNFRDPWWMVFTLIYLISMSMQPLF